MKKTAVTLAAMKAQGQRISMLTCYDYTMARLIDAAGIDAILVGDSLGNVILGYPDTLAVTLDDMIHHGAAVVRGAPGTLVVVDMPFMTYQVNTDEAVRNCGRVIQKTHAGAVKLEGGVRLAPAVERIVNCGIPVMGHVGMTPQSVMQLGGFKVQGKTDAAARRVLDDALALQQAGAFAVVLECVPAGLAREISQSLTIPTIGIGAGAGCDGQVLVGQDMLGMYTDYKPKFVRRFAQVGDIMKEAFAAYDRAVKDGTFPNEAESFGAGPASGSGQGQAAAKDGNEAIKRLY